MRYHARRAIRSLCVVSCVGLISYGLIGCGGGSDNSTTATSSPSPSPSATASPTTSAIARVVIAWGDRTRVEGPSSALSARIVFTGAKPGGGDVIFTAERPGTTGAPSVEYTSTDPVLTGRAYPLTITFYADVNQTGDVVGTAQASATVRADGSIDSTIATYGRIRTVVVPPNQTVAQGQVAPLRFAGYDVDGITQVAVRPGSARISIASGSNRIAVVGDSIRGIKPREASIVVTLDQASSTATPVFVTSDAVVTPVTDPGHYTNSSNFFISINRSYNFTATVTGSTVTDPTVTWALVGAAPSGVSLTADGTLVTGKSEGDFFITGTSVFDPDPSKVIRIHVFVASKVAVAIQAKNAAIVGIGDKIRLTALASDPDGPISDTGVTWKVVDAVTNQPASGIGTIDANGVYTAPTTAGSYKVVATSIYDPNKTDSVLVDVRAGDVGVTIQ